MADVSQHDDVIDSRDIIARIEELRSTVEDLREEFDSYPENEGVDFDNWVRNQVGFSDEEAEELAELESLAEQASSASDWEHGETLIRDSYFTDYIEETINDCYEMPKDYQSGNWPWRHMTMDYEAAAEEAKQDYFSVEFFGVTYWIR